MNIGSSSKLLCLSNSKQIVRALKRSKIVLLLGGNCFHILLPYAELLPVCTIRKVYLLTNTSLLPIAVLKTLFDWTYDVSGLLDQMVLIGCTKTLNLADQVLDEILLVHDQGEAFVADGVPLETGTGNLRRD